MPIRPSFALLLLLSTASAQAQAPDTTTTRLPDVQVEAARGAASVSTAPFSVAVLERDEPERLAEPGFSLAPALRRVPGVFVADRENASLGERLSVRGLGYRAPFGVRGVQVVLDGIPLTLADGQAVLGIADPALVRRAEVVRGPAAALWGNGSGGVLFLSTIPDGREASARARFVGGGYGGGRLEAETLAPLGRQGRHRIGAAVSHAQQDGYRSYSDVEVTRARVFTDLTVRAPGAQRPATTLRLVGAVEAMPFAENPSALTAEQVDQNPRQARPGSADRGAGKESTQGQLAATLSAPTALGDLTATAYGLARRLDNPLPIDVYIDVRRLAGGTRLALARQTGPVTFTLGADAAVQRDDRQNHPNDAGQRGPVRTLDQVETVTQGALFARARLDLTSFGFAGLAVEGAVRGDQIRFSADDQLLADGDDTGSRTLGAWSPQLGASYRFGPALFYASYATAFETPTTTELVNRPGGGGGFNPSLQPQRTRGVEAGLRGVAGAVLYDVAAYALQVEDALASEEGADGRDYFLNRGSAAHRGVEAFAEWQPVPALRLSGSYAWTHLRFGSGGEVEGNALPGVPEHRFAGRARVERWGGFAALEVAAASGVYTDDANTVQTDAYATLDVSVGALGIRSGRATVRPFVHLRNALDRGYIGSVAINAFGGRYFEPAARRTLWAGVEVALR